MKLLLLLAALALAPLMRADDQPVRKVRQQQAEEDLLTASCEPNKPEDDFVRQILIEVQIIALPIEDALLLIEPLRDDKRIEKTVAKLHEMIANKKAKLVGWPMVITKSGNRAVVECVDEIRESDAVSLTPSFQQVETDHSLHKDQAVFCCGNPTAFEARKIGVTLEIEPTISTNGSQIDMQLIPQHVSLNRTDKIQALAGGKKVIIEQPNFHTNKVTTSLTLRDGQSILLGTFHTTKPEGWLELFVLKVSILKS